MSATREIWSHHPGYSEAREQVRRQSMEEDLSLLDALWGRDQLRYGATPQEVKEEALRQLEREWRSERNETAEFFVALHRSRKEAAQ